MSLATGVGAERNLFEETAEHARQLVMRQPILTSAELEKLRHVPRDVFPAETIDITWPVMEGAPGMAGALQRVCTEASKCVGERGAAAIVLSDRRVGAGRAPIPPLLAGGGGGPPPPPPGPAPGGGGAGRGRAPRGGPPHAP